MCDPHTSNHRGTRICILPNRTKWLYKNTCAAVIAGTWVAHLYIWRKESINMFLILSEENNNQQKFYHNENVKSDL